jgi:DNA repair protein RadC
MSDVETKSAPTADPVAVEERPPYRLRLKELPADERPRERLKLRGAKSLSDSDLIAILLNTGVLGTG